ncbi:SLC5 family protein [Shewanella khirikhana]|uniref:Symporter YidK n=1 Tax=Shewanella khirikhana TaxID=1965282 RepID=A0ABM7DRF4_9GAMM|nr:SLC5 family protein [Shewanella khirikhana]AZQ12278.1 putative symporter YidK [Shewanella khirikhana]
MNINLLQLGIFIGLTALVALFTYIKCRNVPRDPSDSRDYFLAGGTLSWVFVAGSIMLTNISAEQIVGMNGAQTLLVAWWEIAAALGLLILAHWLIPMYYRYRCTTTTELLEHRFRDPHIRAMVSVLFMFGYMFILLPVVLYTGALFMQSMFHVNFFGDTQMLNAAAEGMSCVAADDSFACIPQSSQRLTTLVIAALFAVVGSLYAIFGGLRAIAISDTFNGIGLLVMGTLVSLLAMETIGWNFEGIPAERLTLIGSDQSDIPWHTLFTGMIFIQIFYWGTNMVITQRALAAKNVREAQKGLYAAVAMKLLIPLIVVLPGIAAYKLYGDIGDKAYGVIVAEVLPPWLSGAFAAVMAGAVLSTFNSCLNSASALYTLDVHQKYFNAKVCVKAMGQRVALIFAVVSVLLVPIYQNADSIIALLQKLNGLYSMPVMAAFLVAMLFDNVRGLAVRIGLVSGVITYAVFTFVWSPLHYIHLMFITLVVAVAVTLIVNRLLPGDTALAEAA